MNVTSGDAKCVLCIIRCLQQELLAIEVQQGLVVHVGWDPSAPFC